MMYNDRDRPRQIVRIIFIIATVAVAGYFVYSLVTEDFTPYKKETERLVKDNELHRGKYPYQAVSQDNIPEQRDDYARSLQDATALANNISDSQNPHFDPQSLLPRDSNAAQWGVAYPQGEGSLELKNLLAAGTHLGVNTQGSSLKNANQQLRSEPPNPIIPVSIFNNSTITPNMYKRVLEIGEADCV